MAQNVGRGNIKTTDLTGLFLYQEKKRTVYYDIFTKNGYIINNAEARTYMLWSTRYSTLLLIGCLIFYATNNLLLSILTPIAGIGIAEFVFRKAFLYKLPEIKNYKRPEKAGYIDETAEKESYFRIILLILSGFLLAFIIGSNINSGVYKDQLSVVVGYVVAFGALFVAMLNVVALIKKLKNKR